MSNDSINPNDIDYFIRRKAVEFGIPLITNLELANTFVNLIGSFNEVGSYEFKK